MSRLSTLAHAQLEARRGNVEPLELGERPIMRDPRGCRIYARLRDANGAVITLKQATAGPGRSEPTDRCWLFYDNPRGERGTPAATQPLLDPDQIRILIDALERHLAIVSSGAGADTSSPVFDFENASHVLTFFPRTPATSPAASTGLVHQALMHQAERLAYVLARCGRRRRSRR